MSVFVDTNVLLRSVQPSHPLNEAAVRAVETLIAKSEPLVITPQIAAEFWNVATRPVGDNGLGMSPDEAREEIVRLEGFFSVLAESAEVYGEWKRLVVAHGVKGVQAHDARIVAAMTVYGVAQLLTFNTQDFRRYTEIRLLTPGQ